MSVKMSSKVVLRCHLATNYVGSLVEDFFELDYTWGEWETLTQEERDETCKDYYEDFLCNELDSGWDIVEEPKESA